jgi:YidC/Oxa1 family membrane protein insertase
MSLWNLLLLDPMINALLFIYNLLGSYVLAIFLLTALIRVITYPLTQQQQRSARRMQDLAPELEKLKKKYGKDREAMAAKQMELYRENGVNPASGCVPTLIQFPIIIGLYRAITLSLAGSPSQLLNLSQHVYAALPNLNDLIPIQSKFLWLNLGSPDPFFILPVLVVATTFLQQKLLTPPTADPQQASMTQSMQYTMPIMIGVFAINLPSGLSIYWITSGVIGLLQYALDGRIALVNRILGREEDDADKSKKTKPKSKPKKAKK